MSELQSIRQVLEQTTRRRRLAHALSGLWKGLFAGAAILFLALAVFKLAPIPPEVLYGAAAAAGLAALGGFLMGWTRKTSVMETARWVDSKKDLKERLSTALEMGESNLDERWKSLVVQDAAAKLEEVKPRELLPLGLTRASRWALAILAVTAFLGFVPEYRTPEYKKKKADAEIIKDTGRQMVELTKRRIAEKPPVMEPAKKALETVEELGNHLAKASLTRGEALKDLASATEKLKQETKEMRQGPAFKTLEKAANASSKGGSQSSPELQKALEKLQQQMANNNASPDAMDKLKKDLDRAQQEAANLPEPGSQARAEAEKKLQQNLADLAKEAKDMGASLPQLDQAIAALAQSDVDEVMKDLQAAEIELEKLRDMAKTMEKLQMQMDKLGKDLAEQLKSGQAEAAQATLRKMAAEVQGAKLTPEQMQKISEEISKALKPAQEYGEVGDELKKAGEKMAQAQKGQEGAKEGAAEALNAAADSLGKMMSEMGDAQSILASLEALQQAQMAIGNGQAWANTPRPGGGRGEGEGQTSRGGFGTWHDEDSWMYPEFADKWDNQGQESAQNMDPRGLTDRGEGALPDNLLATKVKGQMTPGGPMPSITMKGVSIKGMSKVDFSEVAGAAQSEAQGALSQDQVPRAYQGAVKDYFNDLK